jgi:ABC-2 type transport system ATP-binding protein
MPPSIVEFQQVSKVYRSGLLRRRKVCALRDVTLSVPRGSVFGVLGPNRAGKTTLLKVLLSICRPTSGTVVRLGRPARDRSTLSGVGYLHQCQAFPQYLSATTLLGYYGALALVPGRELQERIPRLLEQVGLADRAGEPIARFSKGMLQRLALAQALVNDPELLVLDEPSEGMDVAARKLLDETLRRRQTEGKTAMLVSHNMADVERLCDLAVVLREGQVAFAGALADLPGVPPVDGPAALQEALEPLYAGASS